MGVDLTLLPFDGDHGNLTFSHTLLPLERRRELWTAIEALPSLEVPDGFNSFLSRIPDGSMKGEHCYGETLTTPYGERLRYTTIAELLKVRNHVGVEDNYKNFAVWSYLGHLPPQTKVALYWH